MAVKAATLAGTGAARIVLMRSIMAVGIGLLLAIMLGLIVVLGILAPILTTFVGWTRSGPDVLPLVLLAFAAAFSF